MIMRFSLWSLSPDRRVARKIVWDGWALRGRTGSHSEVNKRLEKILKESLPKTEKDYRKHLQKVGGLLNQGLNLFQRDFLCIENIKHNSEILEKGRIEKLNDFEKLVHWLRQEKKVDEVSAHRTLREIQTLKGKLKSEIGWAKNRETRLKWSL